MIVLLWLATLATIGIVLFVLVSGVLIANRIRLTVFKPEACGVSTTSEPIRMIERVGDRVILDTSNSLDAAKRLRALGTWGLEWKQGYGQLSDIGQVTLTGVSGRLRHLLGSQPLTSDEITVDKFSFPCDPKVGLGVDFEEVTLASSAGHLPAWRTKGQRNTWVIFVHGHRAPRKEALRALRAASAVQLPALVICYRNDPEVLNGKRDYYRFGSTEWKDLECAVEYALNSGATEVILAGFSLGGAIIANFIGRSELAEHAVGIVLDSPAINLPEIVQFALQKKIPFARVRLSRLLAWVTSALLALRYSLKLRPSDYFTRAKFATPIMLFHGSEDERVPVTASDSLAKSLPELVTYLRANGAGHVESWNIGPTTYEAALISFLEARCSGCHPTA